LKSSRFENALKIILIYPNLTSVQKYFKPLIFESKILFKIQKKERVYVAASLAFGPFRHSAHFRLSIVSHLQLPSAPTSGFHRHHRPSGRAAMLSAADCRPPPRVKSQTEAPSCRLHFPH
jgi:hypothetical protein